MSDRVRKISAIVFGLVLTLTICMFLVPEHYRYEKKIDVIAQQRMIFVFIGELKRWSEWTKWAARDSHMTTEFSDPAWGEGATFRWESFWHGDGRINVTKFLKAESMEYDLTPDVFEISHWQIRLTPAPRQGSTVTWTVEGDFPKNRFARLLAYIWDWRLESDIEKGLARLKKHAELHDAYDVFGGWELPQTQTPAPPPEPVKKKSKSKRS